MVVGSGASVVVDVEVVVELVVVVVGGISVVVVVDVVVDVVVVGVVVSTNASALISLAFSFNSLPILKLIDVIKLCSVY